MAELPTFRPGKGPRGKALATNRWQIRQLNARLRTYSKDEFMLVAPARDESVRVETPDACFDGFGTPCAFSGCSGFLHSAKGSTGVVLCAPWGFEELASRKEWRQLAETIAAAGYPCLRFDYPGTGDSLGQSTDVRSVGDWIAAIDAAMEYARGNAGVRRFVLIGQSIGAALAVEAASRRDDVVGLHLLTPVVEGQTYLRDLVAMSRRVADRLGLPRDQAMSDAPSFLGFAMSVSLAESLRAIDLRALDRVGAENVVVYDKLDRRETAQAVERMRGLGSRVDVQRIESAPMVVTEASICQPLPVEAGHLVASLLELHPVFPSQQPAPARMLPSAITSDAFREQPIGFGPNEELFGVLCRPTHERAETPAVVLLDCARVPHVGWGRGAVDQARALAVAGIASLRVDMAGVGESFGIAHGDKTHGQMAHGQMAHGDTAHGTRAPHYPDDVLPSIAAAIDVLFTRGHRRIVLTGLSVGAQLALTAAQADPRITDVVAVNTPSFVWGQGHLCEGSLRDAVGAPGNGIKSLLGNRRRAASFLHLLAKRNVRRAMAHIPPRWRTALLRDPMIARVERFFAGLAARRLRLSLIYGASDPGLIELRRYFGPNGVALRSSDCTVSILPAPDHFMVAPAASTWLLEHLVDIAWSGGRREPRPVIHPVREPQPAVCPT